MSCALAPTLTLGVAGVTATEVNTAAVVPCTTTVPVIPEWSVQSYGYVPAVANVREAALPGSVSGMLPPVGLSAPKVTLCRAPLICQVTVLPTPMVMRGGENVRLGVVTVVPPALIAVTVTVAVPVFVSPPDVSAAVIVAEPAATPETTPLPVTVATPVLLDVQVAAGNPAIALPS